MNSESIFKLENVEVEFLRHTLVQQSLREALGSMIAGKKGKTTKALCNINLEINQGEHVGIIGRNGAGKSTLLRVLSKVITPTKGKFTREESKHIMPLLELGIGFQPELSGRENCYLAGILLGYSLKEMDEMIKGIIDFSELGNFIDEPVKSYSSGMYARLAFSIATDINPEVLLVDEVFGVGDEFFMRKCIIRMQKLMAEGVTTVFVAHNLDFLVAQCDRLIWLDNGKIISDGNPQSVANEYRGLENHLKLVNSI